MEFVYSLISLSNWATEYLPSAIKFSFCSHWPVSSGLPISLSFIISYTARPFSVGIKYFPLFMMYSTSKSRSIITERVTAVGVN